MEATQMVSYRPPINEIIVVEQLPVIREQLETMRDAIQQDVNEALALSVTEDTVKEIKAVRARLSNDYKALEKARVDVKKKILSPYEQFEAIYRECVTAIYGPADSQLKRKIDEVENGLKEAKKAEIIAYFHEYCLSKNIDFLKFEQAGVTVGLSNSKKSLKAQVAAFIDKVAEEVEYISMQERAAEVMVEFKKSLNVVQAVMTVSKRHQALENEQKRLQQAHEVEVRKTETAQRVEQVVMKETPPQAPTASVAEPLQAPVVAPTQEQREKVLTAKFTLKDPTKDKQAALYNYLVENSFCIDLIHFVSTESKTRLLALRRFLLEGGYEFE